MWKARLCYLLGCWVLLFGALQLVPLVYAIYLDEKASFHSFFSSIVTSGLIGGCLVLGFRDTAKLRIRKLTVFLPVFGITAAAFVCGLPFFFMFPEQGLSAALYDGMSLITTNGTSAYEAHLAQYEAIQLWRAIAVWAGGYLAICLTLSLLSAMNIGGLQLHNSPMPFGDSEVGYARLKATATALYPVYIVVTLGCALMLWVVGAGSAVACLEMAMATISTAGLTSVYGDALDDLWPQVVIIGFLLLSMASWDIHYMRLRKQKLRYGHDYEYRTIVYGIIAAFIVATFMLDSITPKAVWEIMFAVVSAAATSGISPTGLADHLWSPAGLAITLLCVAAVGGAVISTTGGIKQLRAIIIFKTGHAEVERLAHPHAVSGLHYDRRSVRKTDVEAVWLLLGSTVLIMAIGAVVLGIFGNKFQDVLFMSFGAITLSGPLIGLADPFFSGYAGLQAVDYSILTLLMLVGRIEASLFFALFAKALWRG